jgi:hypothetical protein
MHVPGGGLKGAAAKQHSRVLCGPRTTFPLASSHDTHARSHQKIDVVHAQAFIASGFPRLPFDQGQCMQT